ncbi:VCBS repeat-containing protein, partial [Streptomyces sp.]|uniref:FG-GAP repeat domain-containing protein n=1 Tax=Streptomyces sp. TaxID=1931 RepID=UPI002F93C3B6
MRRTRNTIIGAALLPTLTLTLGVVGAGLAATVVTATPAAAADRMWDAPTPLTEERNTSAGVVVTADGTAVTAWTKGTGSETQELWGATRPAGAAQWGAPVRIAADQTRVRGAHLVSGEDGSVTIAWNRYDGENSASHQTSTLRPGAAAWTAPARVTAAPHAYELILVSGPGSRLTAVWSGDPTPGETEADRGTYAADLTAPGGTWSEAVMISSGYPYEFKAAAAADGSVTVAWQAALSGPDLLRVSTRAAGSAEWSGPEIIKTASSYVGDGELTVQSSANGATLITWWESYDNRSLVYRPAGSTKWGPTEYLPADADRFHTSIPRLEADGRVTALWAGHQTLRTATRAVDGTWSQPRSLAENNNVFKLWTPSAGRDGTLAAAWTTLDGELFAVTRSDGVWGKPTKAGPAYLHAQGSVAAGSDGQAVAVWDESLGWTSDSYEINRVMSTATAGAKAGPLAKHRDYVGEDGFPDVYAQRSDGSLLVYRGNAGGTVSAPADAGRWPVGSTQVPFGDLDGDGANDTLVAGSDGILRLYAPERGRAVTPQAWSKSLGSGWSAYDGLTYSGDFTGDGRPDLVARQVLTGDLYLYAGTASAGLTRVGKIGSGWKSLTIVGAGDLNGDRVADLVARTATGDLYRYYGTGRSTIGSGTKI